MDNYKVKLEYIVEQDLMRTLDQLGYVARKDLNNIKKIEDNIKSHLERLNADQLKEVDLTNEEFSINVIGKIINKTIFDNAKLFRDCFEITRGQNYTYWLRCFDKNNLDNNIFEYSHQVWQEPRNGNRGDVTLFMNGFPIVQIELKRSGIDLNEAFKQVIRYKRESFDKNIFKMVQLFIISNESITKYFSNNSLTIEKINNNKSKTKFVFEWADKNNNKIDDLNEFAESFLNKNVLFKMLTNYMVLKNTTDEIVTLRPYQFYAVESIIDHIESTKQLNDEIIDLDERAKKLNAYIWHATGSGKTLTSFKTAQVLKERKDIDKVIFLVDRLDLNSQTLTQFKTYLGENSDDLEETENCTKLLKQLNDKSIKLIVTTIQKLSNVLKSDNFKSSNINNAISNKNFIFIIDECHRTQFGQMHRDLRRTFTKSRLIGFTGTPIFAQDNQNEKNMITTSLIFGNNIHKYTMVNAIRDMNVLKFLIEYIKGPKKILKPDQDVEVESIDIKGYFDSDIYREKIVDYIMTINGKKTKNNTFKSMLVCSNRKSAIAYYWLFRNKYPNFNVATVFSKNDNDIFEDDSIDDDSEIPKTALDKIIKDYKNVHHINLDENNFKIYSDNVQKNVSDEFGKIDLVIVVGMLTTGFNAEYLNTIYLDRKLTGHGIIQTISRANRICVPSKDCANVVSFRTFKKDVDAAVALYSNSELTNFFFVEKTLENLIQNINHEITKMKEKWPNYMDVVNEISENKIKEFIEHMKIINRLLSLAKNFIEYDEKNILLSPKELEEYRSAQKNIANKVRKEVIAESILGDIDFELEVFRTDEINVDYIKSLLEELKTISDEKIFKIEINKIIANLKNSGLKSKAELLEKFISFWAERMFSDEYDDWKNTDIGVAYEEYKMNNINNKLLSFANEFDLDVDLLKDVIKKKRHENKSIDSYGDNIANVINNKTLTIEKRFPLINKIKEFIENIYNDYYLDSVEDISEQSTV